MSAQDSIKSGGTHPEMYYWDGQCCPLCMKLLLYAPTFRFFVFGLEVAVLMDALTNDLMTGIGHWTSDSGPCVLIEFDPVFFFLSLSLLVNSTSKPEYITGIPVPANR